MTRAKWFIHDGRVLEVRYQRVKTSCQIWIYENDRPLGLHSVIGLRDVSSGMAAGQDVIGRALECAMRDVEGLRFHLDQTTAMAAVE